MQIDFPIINNIEDVLFAIQDRKEFLVINKENYIVIDYVYILLDSFKGPYEKGISKEEKLIRELRRECRGLKFDKSGKLIARPYPKFHNIDENEEYHSSNIDTSQPHILLDKLDGSMVHNVKLFFNGNAIRGGYCKSLLMTRKGFSEVADLANAWLHHPDQINSGITDSHANMWEMYSHYTFIYEFIGPSNKIVVDYPENNLILTAARNIIFGTYLDYSNLKAIAAYYKIPVVGEYTYHDVKNDPVGEGCVMRFDTGFMAKIKSSVYVRKHKSKDLVSSFKEVVKMIAEDTLDDVLPQLDETTRDKLSVYRGNLLDKLFTLSEKKRSLVDGMSHLTQKEFAIYIQKYCSFNECKILFMFRKESKTSCMERLFSMILRLSSNKEKLTEFFEEFKLPIWEYHFFKEEE